MTAFSFSQSGLPLPVEDSLRLGAYTRCDEASIKEDMARMHAIFPVLKQKFKQAAQTLAGGQQQVGIRRTVSAGSRKTPIWFVS